MDWNELLNNIKPFLAPMATSVAIIVSTILWWINRRKALSYQILLSKALISVVGTAKRRIAVSFDGSTVEDAHLVIVKVVNTGHMPVNPGEYQMPISLLVGPQSRIVLADVVETWPAELDERFLLAGEGTSIIEKVETNRVTLRPVLLNPEEYVTVQMLVSNLTGKVVVQGHIQGVKHIREWRKRSLLPLIASQFGVLIMCAAMFVTEPSAIAKFGIETAIPAFLLLLIGYLFLLAGNYFHDKQGRFESG
jgi:hypothetical protein